jgi:hypothetical protein
MHTGAEFSYMRNMRAFVGLGKESRGHGLFQSTVPVMLKY